MPLFNKSRQDVYNFYSDPGHGWLEVDLKEIIRLGIKDKITSYSYYRMGYVYLEEDCDYSTFYNRKKELGEEFTIKEHHVNSESVIRSFERFDYRRF